MNIGIFTDTYSPQISGVATSIVTLEEELRRRGHNVYIFTTTDPNADRASEEGRVFRLPSIPFVFFPERRIAIAGMSKFIRLVGELNLDIIHTHTEFSLGLLGKKIAKKYSIPIIHTYHTMYVDYLHYIAKGKILKPNMVKRMTRSFCESYQALIAPTQKVRHHLEECGLNKLIYTIPTGTDLHSFERADEKTLDAIRSELGISKDDPIVLSLGRVAYEKNIDAILDAFPKVLSEIPNAKLVIVGDGPVKAELEEKSVELGLAESVIFTGAVEWAKVGNYYQLGHLFVSASTSETQGLTYIEAMASGLPVVAKRDESIEDFLIDEKTGFLFDSDEELADRLLFVLKNPGRAKQIAQNGRSEVLCYSAETFGKTVEAAYMEVIAAYQSTERKPIDLKPTLLKSKMASQVFSLTSNSHIRKGRSSRRD
ncbi:glycosyltransferase family 4 protein [Listeria kieliensis]|uniref:1,2-diacylglycerol 3-glucosyltransferase n=1 Tax=Listeria kieliensis TaxID=1621700 RepID=A0A3D8TMQ8_9LIST|nr:glycosyltransferase family 4 protein [Listeria kieliensis]RDW99568.1 1,2-diacylglycerol 3-glucosyltransferase [Listeria kieliensis]